MEIQIKKTYKKKPEHNNTPEYNKAYYEKNKEKISKTLKARCVCEHCGREVAYQRLNAHKMSGVCLKNRKASDIDLLKEQVAKLTKLLGASSPEDEKAV